ncbi:BTB/POZ domain-containing protein 3-like [Paramacrobiotus metropolitanus]|uniref:BTB/POZ domain-containing protein 3-like n=1 Tax=Paramacrobiotus metropolitanus TaxID=2943436 RepID=UPI002445989B|nr:BTB/POZ domain-containing protein 3-like [Paramacrobiotus metropolitanus]
MEQLLFCGELSDVQFAVGRDYGTVKIFPALRAILSIRSAVFRTMFYGSVPENCSTPIDISDIHPEAFANMISYVYTDDVKELTLDNVFHTLGCADKYDLSHLVFKCTDFVLRALNSNNCLDMLNGAVQYGIRAPEILEKCLCLIDQSAETVLKSENFCEIGPEALRLILQRDTLTANEDTICSSVDKWAASECSRRNMDDSSGNRREVLGQTLFLIRFPLLTDVQLLDGPAQSGLLLQSEGWDIYRYKNATIKPQLPFHTEPRQNVSAEGIIDYTIPDVRELEKRGMVSDPITVRKMLWSIEVERDPEYDVPKMVFYLRCSGCPKMTYWTCRARGEMRLLPWKTGIAPIKKYVGELFRKDSSCWGHAFLTMEDLLDPAKGYINPADFSLKLQIQMTADFPTVIE